MKHVIWSNEDLRLEDFIGQIEEAYPDASEAEKYQLMQEINDDFLDDDRMNLNIRMDEPILVVGDLGLWNGRRTGYKEISSGNIADCLYAEGDYVSWYVDDKGDFRCDDTHHDGTNHYLYREWKSCVPEGARDELRERIYRGDPSYEPMLKRFTEPIGPRIAEVYGWDLNPKQKTEAR